MIISDDLYNLDTVLSTTGSKNIVSLYLFTVFKPWAQNFVFNAKL